MSSSDPRPQPGRADLFHLRGRFRQHDRARRWLDGAADLTGALLGDVDLHEAMRLMTERVREISGADYAAIGFMDRSSAPSCVVCAASSGLGLDGSIGTRIQLRGLTAAVISAGQPLVIDDLPHDERYDPPTQWRQALSAIGLAMLIPLTAQGEALGVLFVGWRRGSIHERQAANETPQVQIFADYAALALQRVRAEDARIRRERWREATSEMARLLLREVDRDEAMRLVVAQMRTVSGADFVGIILVDPTDVDRACVAVFEGLGVSVPPDLRIPRHGLVAAVMESGERIVSTDYSHQPGFQPCAQWAEALSGVGLGMLIPLGVDREVLGVLFAGWRNGSPHEDVAAGEVDQVQTIADLTAIALQRVRAQGDREHLLLLEDRNCLARDLNDVVLQRLFAAGLHLKTVQCRCPEPAVQHRINNTIRDLDEINHEIRSAIFRRRPDADD